MPKTVQQIVKCCTTNNKTVVQQPKLSNKLSNKSENCPTNCRQLYNKWQLSNKWEKTVQQIWKTVQQTPSVGQFLSKMLYNKPDCWRSVVQQALERRKTVQQISECLMSRPQGSGKGGGLPTGGTYGVCHLLIGKGGGSRTRGGPHFPSRKLKGAPTFLKESLGKWRGAHPP